MRLLLIAILIPFIGCGHDPGPTVWRTELKSPDGLWLATARTDQWGGFGSAWVETVVSLKKLDGTVYRGKPFDVLSYPGGGPIRKAYVLSEANAGGGVKLRMRWLTTKQLEISYQGTIEPDLQVVKFGGVDITLQQSPAGL